MGWRNRVPAGGQRVAGVFTGATAIPELVCPFGVCARSPLPVGRVDLGAVAPGYSYSVIAIAPLLIQKMGGEKTGQNDAKSEAKWANSDDFLGKSALFRQFLFALLSLSKFCK